MGNTWGTKSCAALKKHTRAWYLTSKGDTNSSCIATGVLSLWARHHCSPFPHFTGLSNRHCPGSHGGGWLSSINGFTPKEHDGELLGSQTGIPKAETHLSVKCLLLAVPYPSYHQGRAGGKTHTGFLPIKKNQPRDAGSPGSGAGEQGFAPLRAWHILVLGGLWALPVAV